MKNRNRAGAQTARNPRHSEDLPPILLVMALPEEQGYFQGVISGRTGWSSTAPRQRYKCHYETAAGRQVVIVQTLDGMGNIEAVLGTSSAIVANDPALVLLVGLAGSLRPDSVHLGDVVIANQAKLYSSDKVATINADGPLNYTFGDKSELGNGKVVVDSRDRFMEKSFLRYERKFIQSPHVGDVLTDFQEILTTAPVMLERVESKYVPARHRAAFDGRSQAHLHYGWLLASSHVVDSAEYRDYLVEKDSCLELDVHSQTGGHTRVNWTEGQILAVDMESYGLLRAVEALRTTPPAQGGVPELLGGIVVRGISDLCEQKAESDSGSKEQTRKVAVRNATEVAVRIIEDFDHSKFLAL